MEQDRVTGYLGPELALRGHLGGNGDVVLEGTFDGEIHLDGRVIVARSARVRGPIVARTLAIDGCLEGPVSAGEVLVRPGGHLIGDVRAGSVGLDDGGTLQGTVQMDFELPDELFEGQALEGQGFEGQGYER